MDLLNKKQWEQDYLESKCSDCPCKCDESQCAKCLSVNCKDENCPTHTREAKMAWRKV